MNTPTIKALSVIGASTASLCSALFTSNASHAFPPSSVRCYATVAAVANALSFRSIPHARPADFELYSARNRLQYLITIQDGATPVKYELTLHGQPSSACQVLALRRARR